MAELDVAPRTDAPADAERAAYDELVARSPQGSVFSTSWWLDAVAGSGWRAHAVERQGATVAAWPTVVRRTRFGDVHAGAPLTPFLGPLFAPDDSRHHRRSREAEYLDEMLARIEPCAYVEARCHPAFDYWTPLAWHGFKQTTRYTWRLPDLTDLDAVFKGFRDKVRNDIRTAERRGTTVGTGSLEEFLRIRDHGIRRRSADGRPHAPAAVVERIDEAAAARNARTILLARDADGRVRAGGYFVHDDRYTYYLMAGTDAETRGSTSLVLWKAIERAAERGIGFDFEGSMIRDVERFFRAFGGVPTPYSFVTKAPSLAFRATRAAKLAARRLARS